MKYKKIMAVLMIMITMFCMTVPAFAYSSSPYTASSGSSYQSPYQTSGSSGGSSPYTSSSSGSGSPYTGSSGSGMPGSGTSSGSSGGYSGTMPGSGSSGGSSGTMPGSGTGSGGSYTSGGVSGFGSGYTGGGSAGGASGNEFLNATIDSSGALTLTVPTSSGTNPTSLTESISTVLQKYKNIGIVILGVCVITAIISMLWQITKLGAAGDNQRSRSMAIKGILVSGAAIAIFGSLTLVAGMFWGLFL